MPLRLIDVVSLFVPREVAVDLFTASTHWADTCFCYRGGFWRERELHLIEVARAVGWIAGKYCRVRDRGI